LESDLSKIDDPSGLNSGHRFLQPSANLVSGSKRPFPGSVGSSTPTASASNISSSGGHPAQSFPQQVVSMVGVESSGGVTLPVQRIIEGLPVVTVPGIVAHEVRNRAKLSYAVLFNDIFYITAFSFDSCAEEFARAAASQTYGDPEIHFSSTGRVEKSVGETASCSIRGLGTYCSPGKNYH